MFTYGDSHPLTSFFNLVLLYNKGAAFSFLAAESGWQRYLFTALGIGAALFIVYLLKRHAGQRLFCWALALILGGAIGANRELLQENVIEHLAELTPLRPRIETSELGADAVLAGATALAVQRARSAAFDGAAHSGQRPAEPGQSRRIGYPANDHSANDHSANDHSATEGAHL